MRVQKKVLFLSIFLMIVGFAAVRKITVNYTEDASDLVDQMIATKFLETSNVIKGTVVQ